MLGLSSNIKEEFVAPEGLQFGVSKMHALVRPGAFFRTIKLTREGIVPLWFGSNYSAVSFYQARANQAAWAVLEGDLL